MSRLQANLLLLLAAAIWGAGNIAHKTVLDHLDPLTAVGLTSLIGGVCTLPFSRFRRSGTRRQCIHSLTRVTLLFLIAQYLQQLAYITATVTTASFLVSAASVITPFAAWPILKQRPGPTVLFAAALTFAGSMLLSGGLPGSVAPGDLLALLSALAFALWTVEVSRHALIFQCDFMTASAQFLGVAFVILPISAWRGDLQLETSIAAWPELMVLGVFSTALAFYLQMSAQRHATASHAAIIVSCECVFGAVGAALLLDERLPLDGLAGAALVLAGVLLIAMRAGAGSLSTPTIKAAAGTVP